MNRKYFTTAFKQFQSLNLPYHKYFPQKRKITDNQTWCSLKHKKNQLVKENSEVSGDEIKKNQDTTDFEDVFPDREQDTDV